MHAYAKCKKSFCGSKATVQDFKSKKSTVSIEKKKKLNTTTDMPFRSIFEVGNFCPAA